MNERLKITEIYKSIQGESTWAGLPCIFVRTTGCNLRCSWCDSEYSFYGGEWIELDAIVATVRELSDGATGCGSLQPVRSSNSNSALAEPLTAASQPLAPIVEITGGEPLLQPGTPALAKRLLELGYTVLIETSGERPIETLPQGVIRIMDLKCPDSGECARNRFENIGHLKPYDELKFVLASRKDYEWSREQIRKYELHKKVNAVLISVVFGKLQPVDVVEWMLEDKLPARFQLQMHKFIWEPTTKGV